MPGTARIGPTLVTGLLGARITASLTQYFPVLPVLDGFLRTLEANTAHFRLVPLAHKIFLEFRAMRCVHHRRDLIVDMGRMRAHISMRRARA
jgi:hypothetical protein